MSIYGAFVFFAVYAHTELMNRNPNAIYWEAAKNIFGIAVIIKTGSWFGISDFSVWIDYLLVGYFVVATGVVGWSGVGNNKDIKVINLKT
jgi:alkylglycerol monooxygenase